MNISNIFRNNRRKVTAKQIAATALFVACVIFIWHNSMEEASISSVRSGRVTKAVNEWLTGGGKIIIYERSIRKAAHFLEYALEGGLAVLLFGAYHLSLRRHIGTGALIGLLTALIDETIQLFSTGRDSSVLDVWLDFGGFVFGLLLGILWEYVKRYSMHRKAVGRNRKMENRT